MSAPICMTCLKEHAWGLISEEYGAVCGECVENDPRIEFSLELGMYYPHAYCTCGDYGLVNFGRGDIEYRRYCNGSPRCTP